MIDDKQHITLQLDAHRVALDVNRKDEEFYRQAATLLNQRYQQYLRMHPKASVEQLWMYVALDVAVNLCTDTREKSLQPVVEKLSEINSQLSELLRNTEKDVNMEPLNKN